MIDIADNQMTHGVAIAPVRATADCDATDLLARPDAADLHGFAICTQKPLAKSRSSARGSMHSPHNPARFFSKCASKELGELAEIDATVPLQDRR